MDLRRQSYRPFGTAARLTTVPADQAVLLPDDVSDDVGACLGIPGITAHRAVFADGPITGHTVLVQGILGAVGTIAAQLAAWGGATVIGTVVRNRDIDQAPVHHPVVALDDPAAAERIRGHAPHGVDRIIEVAFSDNIDLDATVAAPNAIIAAYATREARPSLPFWPMLFANLTIRLFGSDDVPQSPNTTPRTISPPRHNRAGSQCRSTNQSRSSESPKPTTASTPAADSGS